MNRKYPLEVVAGVTCPHFEVHLFIGRFLPSPIITNPIVFVCEGLKIAQRAVRSILVVELDP
jgi:hypothetical protein